jgi:hypothetical protein
MRVAGALAALVCGLARGKEEIFEMIESKVFDERPTIEVFTNSTFDPSTIPLLVEQAQMLVPYVMKTGKVKFPPTFYMGAGDKPTFAMEEAVMRIAELDFPEGLEKAGVMGMEWWCQVAPDGVGTGTMHFDKVYQRNAATVYVCPSGCRHRTLPTHSALVWWAPWSHANRPTIPAPSPSPPTPLIAG